MVSLGKRNLTTHICDKQNKKGFYFCFDWLRVIMSVSVVGAHVYLIGPRTSIFKVSMFGVHKPLLEDVIFFNYFCLPVPVFILIATFLFSKNLKNKKHGRQYLGRRLKYYVYLCISWTVIYSILLKKQAMQFFNKDWLGIYELIFSANKTVYYFFIVLALMTIINYLLINVKQKILIFMLILSVLFLWISPELAFSNQKFSILIAWWSPINFVPYPILSVLLARKKRVGANAFGYLFLFVLLMLSAVIEWGGMQHINSFQFNGCALPTYTRISVFIGAFLIFIFFLQYMNYPVPNGFNFMVKYSLGLYCVHMFFVNLLKDTFMKNNRLLIYAAVLFFSWVTVATIRYIWKTKRIWQLV